METREAGQPWEYSLRKYLLLLATLVATVTYTAGFNPPGGVWQDTDPVAGRLAGDPIIRETRYTRYLVFFYCNATAFASSLVVIVLILLLAILHEKKNGGAWFTVVPLHSLRVVMVLDLLSLMGAYAAGTCRDTLTTVYSLVLVAFVFVYLVVQIVLASLPEPDTNPGVLASLPEPDMNPGGALEERLRKGRKDRNRRVLMLLATFAVSVTYVAGMSVPGGFWDHAEGRHHPGDAILKDRHDARLKAFFVCNSTAFVASLLIILLLLDKKLSESDKVRSRELYGCINVALIGLVGAYAAGSCRETATTVYVVGLVGAVLVCIVLQVAYIFFQVAFVAQVTEKIKATCFWTQLERIHTSVSTWLQAVGKHFFSRANNGRDEQINQALEKARSLVLLLATLAAAITYQAGLDPPGGLWQADGDGYKAGDPILLRTSARRYKAFFYCNSVAFVASLVAIVLVQKKFLHKHHALEAAMILDLFGLIGAYAAGSCRDLSTSIYAMALAGVVLVYVVIHVVFFTLDHKDDGKKEDDELVEKRRKRLLLFAILAATITYQAGLTPPSGFLLQDDDKLGHHAGDPVLLNNYPRRYKAFFYCNSVSFMLSIALIILLVNPNLYRPAIRSYALSVCTAAGMFGLMGAYAAGSTQHLKTSFYIFALVAVVLFFVVLLVLVFLGIHPKKEKEKSSGNAADASSREGGADEEKWTTTGNTEGTGNGEEEKKKSSHAKRKYLMLLGILVASVTYQAGLEPPGGFWQGNSDVHAAGDPVMHDNRRPRYLAFFYSNSTSFVASIVVIILLLPKPKSLQENKWWLRVMNTTIVLDLLGLLGAYAAGSSREWETSVHVVALIIAVLAYFAIHVMLSFLSRRGRGNNDNQLQPEPLVQEQGNSGHQAQEVSVRFHY